MQTGPYGQKQLILVGGGGHCKSCIEAIGSTGRYTIGGILDVADKVGSTVLGIPVIGTDDQIESLVAEGGYSFLITAGQIKSPALRIRLYERIRACGGVLETIVAATAVVSAYARIGAGTIVMHHALVNAGAEVGDNCIINSAALLEHDATTGHHVHVSTMAVVNGDCAIGEGCFVGSNSVLNQGVHLAAGTVIGAGTVVTRSIDYAGVYAGNPFQKIS